MKRLLTLLGPARQGIPLAAMCLLACVACSGYASISEREPVFRPLRTALAAPAKSQNKETLGSLLAGARHAAGELRTSPRNTEARENYNYAVGRITSALGAEQMFFVLGLLHPLAAAILCFVVPRTPLAQRNPNSP